jgi:hypothetical protein
MSDAAPALSVAGVSDTGQMAPMIDVLIGSPIRSLPQLPYNKSQIRICLPRTSPFATEAIASEMPAPINRGVRGRPGRTEQHEHGGTRPPESRHERYLFAPDHFWFSHWWSMRSVSTCNSNFTVVDHGRVNAFGSSNV